MKNALHHNPREHLLVLRLSAMGDVAMTIPVIYSVARRYPDMKLTVVTKPRFKHLFVNPPENVGFVVAETEGIHHGVTGLNKLIGQLKRMNFTGVADLHDVLRTRLIRFALRLHAVPVETVDKDRTGRQKLTKKKSREQQRNYVDRYVDVFRRLGYDVDAHTFPGLFPDVADRQGVGIAPFARYGAKTYPEKQMRKVCTLLADAGQKVYLFGAPGPEQERLKKWAEADPRLTVMAGRMSIEEELRTMSRLRVLLSMDSANMHMASLVATPVVSLWGSTIPQCGFLGFGQTLDNALWLNLECQPCSIAGVDECPIGHFACFKRLAPETVAEKVLSLAGDQSR